MSIEWKEGEKMVKLGLFLLFSAVPLFSVQVGGTDWTWLHRKTFAEDVRASNAHKKFLFFSQNSVSHFTQLVFSWNALRPTTGHFSFYAQVRDAATKKWGEWHHMVDWGNAVQRSYVSKSDGFSSYAHVRLEIDNKKVADAFRIKVESNAAAQLSLIHGFSVAISNFNLFKAEKNDYVDRTLRSVFISGMPSIAQLALEHEDKSRICSPVSCAMVVHYLTGQSIDPGVFAAGVFDAGLSVYGSWACNVAHAFEYCKGKVHFFVRRFNAFADIHKQLGDGIPVVVSIRGTLPGAFKPFPHGHLMVVIGWDNDTREVLCHDPASDNHDTVLKRYCLDHFLQAWECSHRLAYVAEPVKLFSKK